MPCRPRQTRSPQEPAAPRPPPARYICLAKCLQAGAWLRPLQPNIYRRHKYQRGPLFMCVQLINTCNGPRLGRVTEGRGSSGRLRVRSMQRSRYRSGFDRMPRQRWVRPEQSGWGLWDSGGRLSGGELRFTRQPFPMPSERNGARPRPAVAESIHWDTVLSCSAGVWRFDSGCTDHG